MGTMVFEIAEGSFFLRWGGVLDSGDLLFLKPSPFFGTPCTHGSIIAHQPTTSMQQTRA